jgi:hypothetical protein
MKKRFVTFYSPGTFVAEQTTKCIASWDVQKALKLLPEIEERYGAKPYGFQFSTKKRGLRDMEPHEIERSPFYYVNCKVQTLADVEAEGPKCAILAQNMRSNKWDRIVTTTQGWAWSQPLNENDVVL